MDTNKSNNLYFYTSLIFAIWFALSAWVWTYLANIFIALPFGLASLFLWYKGKQTDSNKGRYNITLSILIAGLIVSLIALLFFK